MRFGIVEGEPGIFPDPVARVLRALFRPIRRRLERDEPSQRPDGPSDGDEPIAEREPDG